MQEKFSYAPFVNRSPGSGVSINYKAVSVYQCLIFVHLGLWSILVLFKQAQMGKDEVLVNVYLLSTKRNFLSQITVSANRRKW